MQNYFSNFIKKGNPNGLGVPEWPPVKSGQAATVMFLNENSKAGTEKTRDRYLYLNNLLMKK